MAQVSYGTITITDTTDKNIFIRYSANVDGSNSTSSPVSNTKYIGIYCGTAQTETEAMASSSGWTWSEYIGTDGVSVTGITEIYQLRNDSATPTKRSDGTALPTAVDTVNTWSLKVPSYVSGGTYWTSTAVSMSEAPSPRYTTPVKNEALTDSNYNSAMANSIAQSANENANGAMGQANNGIKEIYRVWYRTNSSTTPNKPSTHVTETSNNVNNTWTKVKPIEDSNYCYYFYCEETITNGGISSWTNPVLDMSTLSKYEIEALDSRTKTFFFPGDSSYPGAYVVGKDSNNGLDKTDISTYGFNTRVTTTGISIGYNTAKVLHLKTTPSPASLDFYKPPTISGNTVTEGELAASLSATGLILSKGGVKAGSYNSTASDENQNFVYLSSEDYGIGTKIGDSASDKTDWRQIIGNKFGVDKAGNLYAAGAHIDGDIIAQSLTIGSGANAYSGIAAINISGYSIEIEVVDIAGSTNTKKLIPHLYHNGMNADLEVADKTDFIWYVDNSTSGISGDSVDGSITGTYGSSYRVIYDFDDGAVEGGTATRTLTVDPSKYITRISDTGITIHPEMLTEQSSWIQLDGNGMELFNSSNESIAKYGNTAKIGFDASSRFLMNASSLQAYNNNNQLYFEVNANGLSWGSNTAATTTQVNAAAQTASKYITVVDQNGIKVHAENGTNINYSLISDEGLEIFQGTSASDTKSVAKFGSTARIGKDTGANTELSNTSIIMFDGQSPILQMSGTGATTRKIDIYKSSESTSTGSSRTFNVDFSDSSTTYALYIYHNNQIIRSLAVSSSMPTISPSTSSKSIQYDSSTTVSVSTTVGYTKYTGSGRYSASITISGVSAENVKASKMVVFKYYTGEAPHLSFGSRDESKNKGAYSATFGVQLSGQQEDQFVIGKYNDNKTNTVLEVGNGTDNAHSNALTVDWQGNVEAAGEVAGVVRNFGAVTGQEFADKSMASGSTWRGYATFTLPAGAWLVFIAMAFSTNNTGYRQVTISDSNATSAGTMNRTTRVAATPGANTHFNMVFPAVGNRTYYVNLCQNSGASLTVYGRYTAIKLGNSFRAVT